jgi:hypothetical protein
MTIAAGRRNERRRWKLATISRVVCLLVLLALVGACGSSHHQARTQSGDYDSGLKARAAEFVAALNAKNSDQLKDLVSPKQKEDVLAFIAAYGGRPAALLRFPDHQDGPDTEGVVTIEITCSASQTIVVPQVFSWKNGTWRTFIYLPGQKAGVTDQQCT